MHVSATARRYARSLARVAIERGIEERVGTELAGLQGFFAEADLPRLVLEARAGSRQGKLDLLAQVAEAVDLTSEVRNFLHAVVDEGRFGLFGEIVEGYALEIDRHRGVVEVLVETAEPLDEAQRQTLKSTLESSVTPGRRVRLEETVDPELLGGAVIRVGSVVYDGSLVSQLQQLRQQLIAE